MMIQLHRYCALQVLIIIIASSATVPTAAWILPQGFFLHQPNSRSSTTTTATYYFPPAASRNRQHRRGHIRTRPTNTVVMDTFPSIPLQRVRQQHQSPLPLSRAATSTAMSAASIGEIDDQKEDGDDHDRNIVSTSAESDSNSNSSNSRHPQGSSDTATTTTSWKKNVRTQSQQLREKIVSIYRTANRRAEDGLTFRQRLTKMGLATMLSYGFVSNMSYAVTVSCAWYIYSCRTNLSPIAPGQWKGFLAVYAGFWVFNNIVRPLRLAISVGMVAPQFDRLLNYIQNRWNVSRTVAIATTVFMANVVCTIAAMSFGILMASLLSGVPIFP
jgi:hypothetical protein